MDNVVKYKLSVYRDIEKLNSDGTVILSYNLNTDRTCVKKYVNKNAFEIYKKISDIKNSLLPEIYEMIEYDGNYLIVEEYIKGKSVEEIIDEEGKLSAENACRYIIDICKALESIHRENIIHRDISPDNVIIDENNRARLLDFDIARFGNKNKSMDTSILGTAGFASPEQFGFGETDVRSDVYSLGNLFNYMLTGNVVQKGIYKYEPVHSVIEKAVKFEPAYRYNNVGEMKKAAELCIKTDDLCKWDDAENNTEVLNKKKYGILSNVPGFRTNNNRNKVISIVLYVIFLPYTISCAMEHKSFTAGIIMAITYILIFIVPMWWFGNYGREWDIIPGIKRFNYKIRRNIAIVIYVLILAIYCNTDPIPR